MSKDTETRSPPTVSVVMPTFNRADLLPNSIASILGQDFGDTELLIVDDGSTDNTYEVIQDIRDHDPRLRYKKLPDNRGIGNARQVGLQHVSGRYIALADSDDIWLPGKLAAQVAVLDRHPDIDILFGDFWNIDYVRGTEASGFAETQAGMKDLSVRLLADDLWLIESGIETGILKSNFIAAPTMVIRVDAFRKVGDFDISLMAVDHEFCWRAAVLGARYAYLDRPLIERYRYPSSVSAQGWNAHTQMLDCLAACRKTCGKVQRPDLLTHIRAAEHRTLRNLIRKYSDRGERGRILWAYRESLLHGFSPRTLAFFVLGMVGAPALSLAMNLRARSLRPL